MPDAAAKEARDRVATALTNSDYKFPMGRTTINLAPADVKKEGPSFDLPIALGILRRVWVSGIGLLRQAWQATLLLMRRLKALETHRTAHTLCVQSQLRKAGGG